MFNAGPQIYSPYWGRALRRIEQPTTIEQEFANMWYGASNPKNRRDPQC